jgi:hypothetical protein
LTPRTISTYNLAPFDTRRTPSHPEALVGWQHFFDDAAERLAEAGLPKPLLRRLLFESRLTIGSRVLLVGAADVRLPRLLDGLGIDVTVVEDDPTVVHRASLELPEIEVHLTPDAGPLPFPALGFDAVIVRDQFDYAAGFETRRALLRTAELASLLRPAGELTFLFTGEAATAMPADAEVASEIEVHLDQLPGNVSIQCFGPGGWFRRSAAPPTATLATLRIPAEPIARDQWTTLARVALEARGVPFAAPFESQRPAA